MPFEEIDCPKRSEDPGRSKYSELKPQDPEQLGEYHHRWGDSKSLETLPSVPQSGTSPVLGNTTGKETGLPVSPQSGQKVHLRQGVSCTRARTHTQIAFCLRMDTCRCKH